MLIACPVYNDYEKLKDMVESFFESTKHRDFDMLFVDGGSTDGSAEYCDSLIQKHPEVDIRILHVKTEKPLEAYNIIFDYAIDNNYDLFLTQTDVFFPKCKRDWIDILNKIKNMKNIGVITCWGGGGVSGPAFINGYNWVGAWFTYFPHEVIKQLGHYDNNMPLGYGVDIDYTYAITHKLNLGVWAVDYWVEHMPNYDKGHSWEKQKDIEEQKQEAYRYLREKWKVGEYANGMDR